MKLFEIKHKKELVISSNLFDRWHDITSANLAGGGGYKVLPPHGVRVIEARDGNSNIINGKAQTFKNVLLLGNPYKRMCKVKTYNYREHYRCDSVLV